MRRRALVAAVVTIIAAAAAGCTGQADTPTSSSSSQTTGGPSSPSRGQSKPASAPSKGNTEQTVPTGTQESKKPVSLDKSSESAGVKATLSEIKAVKAKAELPGEVAGPALLISVRLENESKQALPMDTVLVTVYDSSKAPGGEMTGPPNKPLKGTLAPGKSATGDYLFTVPKNRRSPIMVNVTLPTDSPVMVFRGDAPKG